MNTARVDGVYFKGEIKMAKKILLIRNFGGKQYRYLDHYYARSKAERALKNYKAYGYKVRIIEYPKTATVATIHGAVSVGRKCYAVYISKLGY
jgi:hypothetical protein